jgi:hypothetical protein
MHLMFLNHVVNSLTNNLYALLGYNTKTIFIVLQFNKISELFFMILYYLLTCISAVFISGSEDFEIND